MTITLSDIERARERIRGEIVETPLEHSRTLSTLTGARVHLKFENHQFTASFKERGALNRLLDLTDVERRRGVIAMSAGNHAQAVAHHCQRLGIPACIVMPRTTPNAKVEQTRVFQPEIILHGSGFEEARAFAIEVASQRQLTLVHPFDDAAIVAGQGTLGIEMLEQAPQLDTLIVPIGGGGLISGVAVAAKTMRPDIDVIGVQAQRYPAAYAAFHGRQIAHPGGGTVAEGIAVKTPGALTMALIRRHVDDVVLVDEDYIERAIFKLLEIEKTLAEGAGAAAFAALLRYPERFAGRSVGIVISGGNIDMMILSSILQRGLVRSHRLVKLRVEIDDVPGSLGRLTQLLGELDSNIVDIGQQRTFGGASVRTAIVELVLQMRGEEQADQVVEVLTQRGFDARLEDHEDGTEP